MTTTVACLFVFIFGLIALQFWTLRQWRLTIDAWKSSLRAWEDGDAKTFAAWRESLERRRP